MPTLSRLPDGRYSITAALPVGADLRYKYTLGDGFWNAEHRKDGSFRLRQLIVPEQTMLIEERVDTWYDTSAKDRRLAHLLPWTSPKTPRLTISSRSSSTR